MNESLKEHVQKIKKLPTIPVVAQEILGLVRDDLISVQKLEKIVENDPAIAAKIMSVANSAFYGYKVPAKSLESAVLRIGFNSVRSIALGISLLTVMGNGKAHKTLDYQRLFNHSVSVGFVAGMLIKEFRLEFSEEILINGILHDIGFLILNRYFPKKYMKVLDEFKLGTPLLDAEKKVLEFNHAEIGQWLAVKWKLPNTVSDTIRYHHQPSGAKRFQKRIAVIHIADYITTGNIMSPTESDPQYPLDPAALEVLKIKENDLEGIQEKLYGGKYSDELFM